MIDLVLQDVRIHIEWNSNSARERSAVLQFLRRGFEGEMAAFACCRLGLRFLSLAKRVSEGW